MTNTLKVRRAEHGLSQFAAAKLVGMSRNRWHLIEAGHAEPSAAEQGAMADVFNCSTRKLFPRPTRQPTEAR